jgi:hypothetical protein
MVTDAAAQDQFWVSDRTAQNKVKLRQLVVDDQVRAVTVICASNRFKGILVPTLCKSRIS